MDVKWKLSWGYFFGNDLDSLPDLIPRVYTFILQKITREAKISIWAQFNVYSAREAWQIPGHVDVKLCKDLPRFFLVFWLMGNCWWSIPRIATLNKPSIQTICHFFILMTIVFFLCNVAKMAFIILNVTIIFSYNITTNFDIVYAKKLEQVWRLKEDGLTRGNEVTANEEGGSHQSKIYSYLNLRTPIKT